MTILIVDDNEQNLYQLEVLLRGNGYLTVSAANGRLALETARQTPPDLIIADILMPVMDGFALCREWRNDERLRRIPFLFYTATYTDEQDREFALSLGADRFIVKPEEPDVLLRIILDTVRQSLDRPAPEGVRTTAPVTEEPVYLKQYNEVLIRKLEAKMDQLEKANHELERDISERKRLENEKEQLLTRLHQAQKMEAIGQLAGGVAHDFNNLLFGIIGNSELIKKRCGEKVIQDFAQQISDIALKGGGLTRQLLTFARKGAYVISVVDVRKSVGNVINILKHSIDKRITLEENYGSPVLQVKTDAAQLENAILNLAINARDAMPKGGELKFAAQVTELSETYCRELSYEYRSGTYLVISVSDTGIGMDKETQAHIFEPFFTTKEVGKGTGMGLSSVYGFAKQMEGFVHVYSEKGRGSIFKIYLPFSGELETAAPVVESAAVKGSGHVLLVEDELLIRNLGLAILEELGYQVTLCGDGEEAVKYFRDNSEKVDLVILDLIMPKLGGYDCFMELRKINPSISVIISSGYGIDSEVQKMLDCGAKGFIQKPYKINTLSKLVAENIRKRL